MRDHPSLRETTHPYERPPILMGDHPYRRPPIMGEQPAMGDHP